MLQEVRGRVKSVGKGKVYDHPPRLGKPCWALVSKLDSLTGFLLKTACLLGDPGGPGHFDHAPSLVILEP